MQIFNSRAIFLGAIAVIGTYPAARAGQTGYETLADWNSIALARPGEQAGLASSYDRNGNTLNDAGNYAGFDAGTGLHVIGALSGPGELTRFWMPHLSANGAAPVKIFLDGNLAIDTNTQAFLPNQSYGSGPQFRSPFNWNLLGGSVTYEPIPFQRSAVVEIGDGGGVNFYQVGYRLFAPGTTVQPYSAPPTAGQLSDRAKAGTVLANPGVNPAVPAPSAQNITLPATVIPAGTALPLASLVGSGQIGALNLQMRGSGTPSDAQLDGLRLRIRYDNAPGTAVDVPVSQFFGVGHGRADYKSVPMGVKGDGSYYSYWPMPFRNGATVELYNSTGAPISIDSSSVQYTPGPVAPSADYFHAAYHAVAPTIAGQQRYNMLDITGSGHYVGNILSLSSPSILSFEGNDLVTVDGQTTLHGTGMEDAYNGGYYYNSAGAFSVTDHGDAVASSGAEPFNGLLDFAGSSSEQYRWLIGDNVPFTQSLTVDMENYGGYDGVNWGSTAFYYLNSAPEPGAAGLLLLGMAGLLGRRPSARR
jgi:hypothetical protein